MLVLARLQRVAVNVRKHARATRAEVVIEFREDLARLSFSDDGDAFEVPRQVGSLAATGKLGLACTRERALQLGGTFDVCSETR